MAKTTSSGYIGNRFIPTGTELTSAEFFDWSPSSQGVANTPIQSTNVANTPITNIQPIVPLQPTNVTLYYKTPDQRIVTNVVPSIDKNYWLGQGWSTSSPSLDYSKSYSNNVIEFKDNKGNTIVAAPGSTAAAEAIKQGYSATGDFKSGVVSAPKTTAITPTMGTKILDEADLQAKRKQLATAGIPQTEWSKYISAPDAQGRLFWSQPATLYSQTGEKKIVASGSSEAGQLMKQGWTLQPQKFSGDAITSNSLRPEAEIKLDAVEKNNYPVVSENSTIASSKITRNTIADYVSKYFPETPTEKEYGTMSDEISKLIGEIGGKESYYQQQLKEQEKTTGINVKKTEQNLININNEIKTKTAALEARVAEIQATPMTLLRQTGAEAAARRVAQADIMFLQSEANAYMNNITFAKQIAQEAVDVKYNPILEQLNIKTQQLKLLEGKMGKEEEKYSNALQLYLAEQKQQVADQKELETSIQNVKLQAINDGITDPGVLAQISNAKTVDGALQIYGTNKPVKQVEQWSVPYSLGGDLVQKNLQTGEVRVAVNVAAGRGGGGGITSGITGLTPVQEKSFWSAIDAGKTQLQKGESWGNIWNRIKAQFPQVSDEMIDNGLGTSWRKEGAYEKFQVKTEGVGNKSNLTAEQLSIVNDAKAAIDQVKQRYGDWNVTRNQIIERSKQQYGFDPSPYL